MSDTITVPAGLTFEFPAALRGPQGEKGEDGKSGMALFMRGQWKPVVGGLNGESGQSYLYQYGEYRIADGMCHLRGYIQFATVGDIQGQLVLKGLPIPTANIPVFQGGDIPYFSNPRPGAGPLKIQAAGGKSFAVFYNVPQPGFNPVPCYADTTINYHTQMSIVFDYFID